MLSPSLPRRTLLGGVALLASPTLPGAESAWPERPIRWIVNFPPAGAADILSRALGDWFGDRLGQPIVIENRPGAGGMVGSDLLAKARGDTHMVMLSSAASHGIGPVLYANVPYDPLGDFTHLHLVGTFPSVLLVNPAFPARTLAEFIDHAKAAGRLQYASGGNGTMNHLTGQLLARAAGVELTHVPYRGSAPAMTDVMGGQLPAVMESLPTALGHIRAGRLRPISVSEARRDPTLPDVPSFSEAGFPAVISTNWFGFSTTAGIPDAIGARWQALIGEALASSTVKERFAAIGVRPGDLGAAEYTSLISRELMRWREVIRNGGIRAD